MHTAITAVILYSGKNDFGRLIHAAVSDSDTEIPYNWTPIPISHISDREGAWKLRGMLYHCLGHGKLKYGGTGGYAL